MGSDNQESDAFHEDEQESDTLDRLSQLPEPLLVQIISLLDMKDAVKTGILSKLWKHLWTHVDKIAFEFDYDEPFDKMPQLISFVDHTLMRRTCPNLKEFVLVSYHEDIPHDVLDRWLQWVFKKNVKFLRARVPLYEYSFPEWFYHNSSLEVLNIHYCRIKRDRQFAGWTSLKCLRLSCVCTDDKQIANVISGCPVLETLIFDDVIGISQLNVISPSVKTLIIYSYVELEINGPWIQKLEIAGCVFGPGFRLVDLSSLEYAVFDRALFTNFDGNIEWHDVDTKLLQSIVHVKELIFGPLFIQAFSLLKLSGGPHHLFKCKHVTLRSSLLGCELPGIVCLLNSSPGLETLVIDVVTPFVNCFQTYYNEILDFNEDGCFSMDGGKFLGLKNIEISRRVKMCTGDSIQNIDEEWHEFKLVTYLLKNAHALEKLFITSMMDDSCKCSTNCGLQYVSQLSDKIICNCLGGSGAYEVEFRKNKSYAKFSFCNSYVNSTKRL